MFIFDFRCYSLTILVVNSAVYSCCFVIAPWRVARHHWFSFIFFNDWFSLFGILSL